MEKREIKYRCFSKQYKTMHGVTMMLFDTNELDHEENLGEPKNMDGFEIMQFTGLKDKNGKEIYEGDVVKYKDHPTGVEDGTGNVYWKDGKWMVTWSMIPLGDFGTAWLKIIGNIYEHPELLTPNPSNNTYHEQNDK